MHGLVLRTLINLYQDNQRIIGQAWTKSKAEPKESQSNHNRITLSPIRPRGYSLGLIGHLSKSSLKAHELLTWFGPRSGSIQPSKAQAHLDFLATDRTLRLNTLVRRTVYASGLKSHRLNPNDRPRPRSIGTVWNYNPWYSQPLTTRTPSVLVPFGNSCPLATSTLWLLATLDKSFTTRK